LAAGRRAWEDGAALKPVPASDGNGPAYRIRSTSRRKTGWLAHPGTAGGAFTRMGGLGAAADRLRDTLLARRSYGRDKRGGHWPGGRGFVSVFRGPGPHGGKLKGGRVRSSSRAFPRARDGIRQTTTFGRAVPRHVFAAAGLGLGPVTAGSAVLTYSGRSPEFRPRPLVTAGVVGAPVHESPRGSVGREAKYGQGRRCS